MGRVRGIVVSLRLLQLGQMVTQHHLLLDVLMLLRLRLRSLSVHVSRKGMVGRW